MALFIIFIWPHLIIYPEGYFRHFNTLSPTLLFHIIFICATPTPLFHIIFIHEQPDALLRRSFSTTVVVGCSSSMAGASSRLLFLLTKPTNLLSHRSVTVQSPSPVTTTFISLATIHLFRSKSVEISTPQRFIADTSKRTLWFMICIIAWNLSSDMCG